MSTNMPVANGSDELLTVAEIARTLKVNQQTVRNWISAGLLPAFRIGRRVRIARSDFTQFIDQGSRTDTSRASHDKTAAQEFWDGAAEPVPDVNEP